MHCCTHRFQSLLIDTAPVVKDFESLGLVRRVDAGREIGKPSPSYAPSLSLSGCLVLNEAVLLVYVTDAVYSDVRKILKMEEQPLV